MRVVRFRYILPLLATLLGAAFGPACSSGSDNKPVGAGASGTHDDFSANDGKLRVATTVAPLTNIVLNVAGDRAHIHGLIPDGVDSHTFEPKPSDAKVLAKADILIMNGAHLEGSTEKIAQANMKDASKIYHLADSTLTGEDEKTGFLYDFSFPKADGDPNPHLWMNPQYALKFGELTLKWLSDNDVKNKDYYQQNFDKFAAQLKALDAAIEKDVQSVPAANRKLLTYHDSWAYWARRYGWTVIGAIQPSDFKEPSAKEVGDLITQIKKEKVPAIFGSEVFPSKTMKTIASETGAKFEDQLRDDSPPGKETDVGHTYLGMLIQDMQIMLVALGGNANETGKLDPANTFGK